MSLAAAAAILGPLLQGLFNLAGNTASGNATVRSKQLEIDWLREAAEMAQRATEEENKRRSAEAQHRAANLTDVANMFKGLDFGPGGDYMNRFDRLSGAGGDISANTAPLTGLAGQVGSMNFDDLRGIADILMNTDDRVDLRKSAMHELDRNSGMLNAMLAQSGVSGSGFAAGQQRGLMTDTMMGLAQAISQNRFQNLMGAGGLRGQAHEFDLGARGLQGNLLGQAASLDLQGQLGRSSHASGMASLLAQLGQLQLNRLSGIADLYRDDAFGPNLPYEPTV